MALKYTILKVALQIFSKVRKSDRGFTLIELIVGLSIMLIVSGLAMNALVEANAGFSKDKRNIESNQNMSVILDMIGNDIKQAGENISDNNFPTIEFNTVVIEDIALTEDIRPKMGSSKIIVRRAVIDPLTLCESIPANANPTTKLSLIVADNTPAIVTSSANCDVGTSSSKLFAARPSTEYALTATTDPVPSPSLATLDLILPRALRKARDYRCQLDDLNPTVAYDDISRATDTFCNSSSLEVTRVAVSNLSGQFLIFNQTNETVDANNTATAKKYGIITNTTGLNATATANNDENRKVAYPIGSPIYVIEERVYTLSKLGNFQLSINGSAPKTLTKKIDNFIVSAKTYTNSTEQIVNPKPAGTGVNPVATSTTALTTINPICYSPTTPPEAVTNPQATDATETNPQYICKFNSNTAYTDPAMNWKTLAGIKVELQAKYDSTGGASETSTNPGDIAQVAKAKEKLSAKAEFFPRNVLSK
ncbi:PilW family protein [Chamaesiphon sp.]|uniref:PilW family protein n=1 Tax=Chamaesiphon sp. TaxID=2814140 RepID=UPI0035945490